MLLIVIVPQHVRAREGETLPGYPDHRIRRVEMRPFIRPLPGKPPGALAKWVHLAGLQLNLFNVPIV